MAVRLAGFMSVLCDSLYHCVKCCSFRFQDVAAFTEHLSQQLAQLDDANIHTLMDSESQIQSLMRQLDIGLREIHVGCL